MWMKYKWHCQIQAEWKRLIDIFFINIVKIIARKIENVFNYINKQIVV